MANVDQFGGMELAWRSLQPTSEETHYSLYYCPQTRHRLSLFPSWLISLQQANIITIIFKITRVSWPSSASSSSPTHWVTEREVISILAVEVVTRAKRQ